jgi:hypothetical protein
MLLGPQVTLIKCLWNQPICHCNLINPGRLNTYFIYQNKLEKALAYWTSIVKSLVCTRNIGWSFLLNRKSFKPKTLIHFIQTWPSSKVALTINHCTLSLYSLFKVCHSRGSNRGWLVFSYSTTVPGNTKGGSITVPLTSCLTGLDYPVLQIKTKIVCCHRADSKPVKLEVNGTVILPPLVFPDWSTAAPPPPSLSIFLLLPELLKTFNKLARSVFRIILIEWMLSMLNVYLTWIKQILNIFTTWASSCGAQKTFYDNHTNFFKVAGVTSTKYTFKCIHNTSFFG